MIIEKVWDALTTVIKMNDKVVSLADVVKSQQDKIENLTGRLIRLETALEFMMKKEISLTHVDAKKGEEQRQLPDKPSNSN